MLEAFNGYFFEIWSYLVTLLNINEEYLTQKALSGGKAFLVIIIGFFISRLIYKYTLRVFDKYNLKDKINKLEDFLESDEEIKEDIPDVVNNKKLTERIKVDIVAAKSFSYYIFLFFFKQALLILHIEAVAESLTALLDYLPSLFIGIFIWFFGIRFANFVYDVTYHTLSIAESQSATKTSKIIATGSKGLILFLTFTLVLNFTKLIERDMIYVILIGFVSMLSIAGWIAFGLWGKRIAQEILENFKK